MNVTAAPAVVVEPEPMTTTDPETASPAPPSSAVEDAKAAALLVSDKYAALQTRLMEMTSVIRDVVCQLKQLQKEHSRTMRSVGKRVRRQATVTDASGDAVARKVQPSGFTKPALLSDEMCAFLQLPAGSMLARTAVTRRLNEYIRSKGLQDTADKRKIIVDDELAKILACDGRQVTFFNLQSHIKRHFQKITAPSSSDGDDGVAVVVDAN